MYTLKSLSRDGIQGALSKADPARNFGESPAKESYVAGLEFLESAFDLFLGHRGGRSYQRSFQIQIHAGIGLSNLEALQPSDSRGLGLNIISQFQHTPSKS